VLISENYDFSKPQSKTSETFDRKQNGCNTNAYLATKRLNIKQDEK
jgi:hypothetical protein